MSIFLQQKFATGTEKLSQSYPISNMASTASKTAHRKRLAENDSCVLYHQTDLAAARAILSSQKMLRGSGGLVGGGIYFAASSACTQGKAHSHGVVLSCEVRLGKYKPIDSTKGCPDMTYTKLLSMNRDSVMITGMQTGVEFVVYNFGQISNIKWHSGEKVTPVHDLAKGQRVQAQRKKLNSNGTAGVICYLNRDGTYDVKFDDGNKEEYIPRKKIKKSKKSHDLCKGDDSMYAPKSSGRTLYSCEITYLNTDGSYDVKFTHGDKRDYVPRDQLKKHKYKVGDRGDSYNESTRRNKRATHMSLGVITYLNTDGSYDIKYDNKGEEEYILDVMESRGEREEREGGTLGDIQRNQRVSAPCKSTSSTSATRYSGSITCLNSDGTYDVKFDDGDKRQYVPRSEFKLLVKHNPKCSRGHSMGVVEHW